MTAYNGRTNRERGSARIKPLAHNNRARLRLEHLEDRDLPSLFVPGGTFKVGGISSLAVGDFNGDGKPDLVITNHGYNAMSVLLGNGDGTFKNAVNFAVGSLPQSVAVADFNGDGKLDLVVANEASYSVSVLLGNGDGTFQNALNFAAISYPSSVAVADLNGDGKLDLVVSNNGFSGWSVLLGNGNGTFQNAAVIFGEQLPDSVAVADLNNDGKPDLVENSAFYGTSVLLGNGDGTFQNGVNIIAGASYPQSVALADINGDGKPDLIVVKGQRFSDPGSVSVLLGNGDGTFQNALNFAVGSYPLTVAVADLNGDGKLDLVTSDFGYGTTLGNVSVLLGNGNGTFQNPVNFSYNHPFAVVVADLNGDGRPDLVIANDNGTVSVLLGHGNHTSSLSINAPASPKVGVPFSITVSALTAGNQIDPSYNGTVHFTSTDGAAGLPPDYTFTSADAGSRIFNVTLNTTGSQTISATDTDSGVNGSASFNVGPASTASNLFVRGGTLIVGHNPHAVAVGDFNGDGKPDLVTANFSDNTVSVLLANGDGTFKNAVNVAVGSLPQSVAVADVNGDSKPDLVVANFGSNSVSLLLGNGNGTFQNAVNFTVGYAPYSVAVADVNGDGHPDLIVANEHSSSVSVLLGKGNGTFQNAVNFTVGRFPDSVAVADVNGDGKPDLIVSNGFYGTASVLLGNGDGTFQNALNFGVGAYPISLAVADVNGDGRPDLIVADIGRLNQYPGSVSVLLGNGDGTFQNAQSFAVGSYPDSVAVADLNGDGKLDLVTTNPGTASQPYGTVSVLLGNGDGTFQNPVNFAVDTHPNSVAVADLNGDGRPDLVTANYGYAGNLYGTVSVLLNNGSFTRNLSINGPANPTVGVPFSVTVNALTVGNQIDHSYNGTVHFTSSDGLAGLPTDYTFTSADAGSHTFSVTLKTTGPHTVSVTDTNSGVNGSRSFNVAPAATAYRLTAPANSLAGNPFSITVTAQDSNGNLAAGYLGIAHFINNNGQAILPPDYTFTASDAGSHTFTVTLKTAGSQIVTAVDTVTSAITGFAVVNDSPAAASHFSITDQGTTTAGGGFLITLTALDPYGNTATGYAGSVHFTSSDNQASLPANYTFIPNDSGSRTFLVTLKTAGAETVTATDTSASSITATTGVSVSAAAASHFNVTGPATSTAGSAFSITVTALDPYGNTDTGYGGIVHFTSSDGQAILPTDYTFTASDAGSHTFTVTLKTAGAETLTATDKYTSSITGSTGMTVSVAAASRFSITGQVTSTAGRAFTIIITALDSYGNTAAGYSGIVHFKSSDNQASLPPDSGFVPANGGSRTFTVTLKTAGADSLTVTDTNFSSITGSAMVSVSAATASHFVITAPNKATAGKAFSITVTALDHFGNLASGYLGTIHFTSTDTAAVLPANYTFTSSDGGQHTFNVTLTTVGKQSITIADTTNSKIKGTKKVTVIGAPSDHFHHTPPPPPPLVQWYGRDTEPQLGDNLAGALLDWVHYTSGNQTTLPLTNDTLTRVDHGTFAFDRGNRESLDRFFADDLTFLNSIVGEITT